MQGKFYTLIHSRKFWAAVIGVLVVVLRQLFPDLTLSDTEIASLVSVIAAFIIGTGLEGRYIAG